MHVMVPFASTLSEACVHALRDLQLPNLSRLLARLAPTVREGGDEYALSMPHERAFASALGWQGADGCLPWAARLAQTDGIDTGGELAWGLLTPVHWHLAADHVALVDPAELALADAESRALLEAVQPLFESEGWRIEYGAPLRWYAAHASLRDLPCAAIERVIGRNVDIWMPADPRVALVRRLQSEVQMLLYTDATNEAREARGALAVNSFWLSGCGVRQTPSAAPDLHVDDALRASALAEDWADWADAWRALDAGPIAELLRAAGRGEPVALTLCGERHAQRFEASRQSFWQRAGAALRSPAVAPVLEAL
ncbi:MAG TPA: hypothetical protein PLG77_06090 [Burkholderiaceae bacterium]|nr:hypothetical protein [Burkholderiaceae bacterium]